MRRLVLAGAVLVVLAACGRGEDMPDLGAVKRGDVQLAFTGGAGVPGGDGGVGFKLTGPFDLSGRAGELPKAELTFTRIGVKSQPATFVSDGQSAYVKAGGRTTPLSGEQLDGLRLTEADAGIVDLDLDKWATGKVVRKGDRVEADVDPVRALNDVFTLAGQFEAVGQIEGKAADQLRKAVTSARMVVEQDRRLTLDVAFAADAEASVREALGDYAAAWLRLDVEVRPR